MAVIRGSFTASVGSVASPSLPGAGPNSSDPVSMCEIIATLNASGVATFSTPHISGFIQSFELDTEGSDLAGTITLLAATDLGATLFSKASLDPDTPLKTGADADFTTRDVAGPLTITLTSSSGASDAAKQVRVRIYASRHKG